MANHSNNHCSSNLANEYHFLESNSSYTDSDCNLPSINKYDYILRNTTRDDLELSCSINDSDIQNLSNISNPSRYDVPSDNKDLLMNARLARRFDNDLLALTENNSFIYAEDDPDADDLDNSMPLPEIRMSYSILEDESNEEQDLSQSIHNNQVEIQEESPETVARRRQNLRERVEQIKAKFNISNHPQPEEVFLTDLRETLPYRPQQFQRCPQHQIPSFSPYKKTISPRNLFNTQIKGHTDYQLIDNEDQPDEFFAPDYMVVQDRKLPSKMMSEVNANDMLSDQEIPNELNMSHITQEYEPVYQLPMMSECELERALHRPQSPERNVNQTQRPRQFNNSKLINLSRDKQEGHDDGLLNIYPQASSISPFKNIERSIPEIEYSQSDNLIELQEKDNFPVLFSPESYQRTTRKDIEAQIETDNKNKRRNELEEQLLNIRHGMLSFQLPHQDILDRSSPDVTSTPVQRQFRLPDSSTPKKPKALQNRIDVMLDAYRQEMLQNESIPNDNNSNANEIDIMDDFNYYDAPTKNQSLQHSLEYESPPRERPNYDMDLSDFERWEQRCNEESFDIEEAVQNEAILSQNKFNQNLLSMEHHDQMLFDEEPPGYFHTESSMHHDLPQRDRIPQSSVYPSPRQHSSPNNSFNRTNDDSCVYPDHSADLSDFERWEQQCNESFDIEEAVQAEQAYKNGKNINRKRFEEQLMAIADDESQLFDENELEISNLDASAQFPEIYCPLASTENEQFFDVNMPKSGLKTRSQSIVSTQLESPASRSQRRQQMRDKLSKITLEHDLSNYPQLQEVSPNLINGALSHRQQSFKRIPRHQIPSFSPPERTNIQRNRFSSLLTEENDCQQLDNEEQPDEFYATESSSDYEAVQDHKIPSRIMDDINAYDMISDQDTPDELDISHIAQEYESVYQLPMMSENELEEALKRPKTPQRIAHSTQSPKAQLINHSYDRNTENDKEILHDLRASVSPFKTVDRSTLENGNEYGENLIELHSKDNFPALFSPGKYRQTMSEEVGAQVERELRNERRRTLEKQMQNIRFGRSKFQLPHPNVCDTISSENTSRPTQERFQLLKSPTPVRPKALQNRIDLMLAAYREDMLNQESLPDDMSVISNENRVPAAQSQLSYDYDSPTTSGERPNYEEDLSDFERWEKRCNEESFDVEEEVLADNVKAEQNRRRALLNQNQFAYNILNIAQNDSMLFDEVSPNTHDSIDFNQVSLHRVTTNQKAPVKQTQVNINEDEVFEDSREYPDHAAGLSDFERWEQKCNEESFDIEEAVQAAQAEAAQVEAAQAEAAHIQIQNDNSNQNRYNQHLFTITENEPQLIDENEPDVSNLDASSKFPEIYSPRPLPHLTLQDEQIEDFAPTTEAIHMLESPEKVARRRQIAREQLAQMTVDCNPTDSQQNEVLNTSIYTSQPFQRRPQHQIPSFSPERQIDHWSGFHSKLMEQTKYNLLDDEDQPDEFFAPDFMVVQDRKLPSEIMSEVNANEMLSNQEIPNELNMSHIAHQYEPVYQLPAMSVNELERALKRPKTPKPNDNLGSSTRQFNNSQLINLSQKNQEEHNDGVQNPCEYNAASISPFKYVENRSVTETEKDGNFIELHERDNFPELFSPAAYRRTLNEQEDKNQSRGLLQYREIVNPTSNSHERILCQRTPPRISPSRISPQTQTMQRQNLINRLESARQQSKSVNFPILIDAEESVDSDESCDEYIPFTPEQRFRLPESPQRGCQQKLFENVDQHQMLINERYPPGFTFADELNTAFDENIHNEIDAREMLIFEDSPDDMNYSLPYEHYGRPEITPRRINVDSEEIVDDEEIPFSNNFDTGGLQEKNQYASSVIQHQPPNFPCPSNVQSPSRSLPPCAPHQLSYRSNERSRECSDNEADLSEFERLEQLCNESSPMITSAQGIIASRRTPTELMCNPNVQSQTRSPPRISPHQSYRSNERSREYPDYEADLSEFERLEQLCNESSPNMTSAQCIIASQRTPTELMCNPDVQSQTRSPPRISPHQSYRSNERSREYPDYEADLSEFERLEQLLLCNESSPNMSPTQQNCTPRSTHDGKKSVECGVPVSTAKDRSLGSHRSPRRVNLNDDENIYLAKQNQSPPSPRSSREADLLNSERLAQLYTSPQNLSKSTSEPKRYLVEDFDGNTQICDESINLAPLDTTPPTRTGLQPLDEPTFIQSCSGETTYSDDQAQSDFGRKMDEIDNLGDLVHELIIPSLENNDDILQRNCQTRLSACDKTAQNNSLQKTIQIPVLKLQQLQKPKGQLQQPSLHYKNNKLDKITSDDSHYKITYLTVPSICVTPSEEQIANQISSEASKLESRAEKPQQVQQSISRLQQPGLNRPYSRMQATDSTRVSCRVDPPFCAENLPEINKGFTSDQQSLPNKIIPTSKMQQPSTSSRFQFLPRKNPREIPTSSIQSETYSLPPTCTIQSAANEIQQEIPTRQNVLLSNKHSSHSPASNNNLQSGSGIQQQIESSDNEQQTRRKLNHPVSRIQQTGIVMAPCERSTTKMPQQAKANRLVQNVSKLQSERDRVRFSLQSTREPHQEVTCMPPHAPSDKTMQPLCSRLQPPVSIMKPTASSLRPPSRKLQPPASILQPPVNSNQPPKSNFLQPSSIHYENVIPNRMQFQFQQPLSNRLQPPVHNIQHTESYLRAPSNRLKPPISITQSLTESQNKQDHSSIIQPPVNKMQQPFGKLQPPLSKLRPPLSKLQQPDPKIKPLPSTSLQLSSRTKPLLSNVQPSTTSQQQPTISRLQQPTNRIPSQFNRMQLPLMQSAVATSQKESNLSAARITFNSIETTAIALPDSPIQIVLRDIEDRTIEVDNNSLSLMRIRGSPSMSSPELLRVQNDSPDRSR